jgi:hypothetical protein
MPWRIKGWRRELPPFGEELPKVSGKIESPEILQRDTRFYRFSPEK